MAHASARHILVPTQEACEELKSKIETGADFAEMAKEHSDDPSAEKGGDLGYFKQGEMLPALEKAALIMKPGEISPVLQTHLGFHILKLTEYQIHNPQNDPKIKEEIKEALFRQKSEEKLKKWLEKLRKLARIKIML